MVAAFETDTGDVWTVYASSELTNADVAVGSPFSASFSAFPRSPDGVGGGNRAAFADSRGLLYAKSDLRWGSAPLDDLIDLSDQCVRRDETSGENQLVVNGQLIPLSGATYVDIDGGQAIVEGRRTHAGGGRITWHTFAFTFARVHDSVE
jgi:hypothetical protein